MPTLFGAVRLHSEFTIFKLYRAIVGKRRPRDAFRKRATIVWKSRLE